MLAATEQRALRQNALIVFEDESGVSLLPSVRATWGAQRSDAGAAASIRLEAAVIGWRLGDEPDGSDAHLVFQLRPGAYNDNTDQVSERLNEVEQVRAADLGWPALISYTPPGQAPGT